VCKKADQLSQAAIGLICNVTFTGTLQFMDFRVGKLCLPAVLMGYGN
jgi:hypothetical protein